MIWQPITPYPAYAITTDGFVMNLRTGRQKKPYMDRKGYWRYSLYIDGKQYNKLLHRLLALTFLPNPRNCPQVNHINGKRDDNRLENLEWCTASENVQDGFDRGRKSWNKGMKSTANMTLEDLARELPRLQELAKALWNTPNMLGAEVGELSFETRDGLSEWQHHLQQMVIAENPIEYLGQHL